MSEDVNDAPKGETEAEYYERIKSAPGVFSDFGETAKTVVERAKKELERAEHLFEHSSLAPNPHPEGQATEEDPEPQPVDESGETVPTPDDDKNDDDPQTDKPEDEQADQKPVSEAKPAVKKRGTDTA